MLILLETQGPYFKKGASMTDEELTPEERLRRTYLESLRARHRNLDELMIKIFSEALEKRLGKPLTQEQQEAIKLGIEKDHEMYERLGLYNPKISLEERLNRFDRLHRKLSEQMLIIETSLTEEEKRARFADLDKEFAEFFDSLNL